MTGKSFLDLPSNIRFRIYFHAGLVRPCPVTVSSRQPPGSIRTDFNMNFCVYRMKYQGRLVPAQSEQEFDCFCPFFPLALLRVCRSIYREGMVYFYGENKFQLLGHTEDDLEILLTLPRLALASITSLLIRLNCSPCLRGHDEIDTRRGICRICRTPLPEDDSICGLRSVADQRYLSVWAAVCKYLANSIQPDRLNFTFIGDVHDVRAAQDICSSIKLLPCLKTCNIRLGRSPDYELSEIARRTAQQQTNQLISKWPFEFLKLPQELRWHVLGYTHLTPAGGYASQYKNIAVINNRIQVRGHSFAIPWRCCWYCNDTKSNCCCPTGRAAVSENCSCRRIPHELFRASKQMKAEAEHVFFSSNCFDFNMDVKDNSSFIASHWSKENRKSIRQIRIMFDDDQIKAWKETLPAWQELLELIRRDFNVGNLCLVVNTEQNYDTCLWMQDDNQLRYVYDAYCQIALEVQRLHGLLDLHLEFPWFRGLEVLLEKKIMGDDYDSSIGQKLPKQVLLGLISKLPDWHAFAWEKVTSDYDKVLEE